MSKVILGGCGEMVDAQGLGPCGRKALGVRVPSSAHMERKKVVDQDFSQEEARKKVALLSGKRPESALDEVRLRLYNGDNLPSGVSEDAIFSDWDSATPHVQESSQPPAQNVSLTSRIARLFK